MKKYSDKNVFEATKERLDYIFNEFNKVIVAFSGGKDSGVLLNLTLEKAKELNQLNKVIVYHLDYEAQYQDTTDYVQRTFDNLPDEVTKAWFCVPIKAQCSTSMFQSYWQPWKFSDREIWCRELPDGVYHEENFPYDWDYEIDDYSFNIKFEKEIAKKYGKTAVLVGIRTQESLHRYKAINKDSDKNTYHGVPWTTKVTDNLISVYLIYDWLVDDVWIANYRHEWDYNKLYDLMYQAGVPISSMRVASPFNDAAQDSLKLYKVLDPNNWGKLIGRVNGVNFTALYGGTTAMGWNKIEKPDHFTWKEYMYFLLDTLPEHTRDNYLRKLNVSIKYWTEEGGALPKVITEEIPNEIKHEKLGKPKNNRNYKQPYEAVRFDDYLDEIDISKPNLLPTYKRMCIAILKNDTSCKTLGFGQTKDELRKRKEAVNKYAKIL